MITLEEITNSIIAGKFTEAEVNAITDAINYHRKLKHDLQTAQSAVLLREGMTVVAHGLKDFDGTEGEIIKIKRTKALIKITVPSNGRYKADSRWNVPIANLKPSASTPASAIRGKSAATIFIEG